MINGMNMILSGMCQCVIKTAFSYVHVKQMLRNNVSHAHCTVVSMFPTEYDSSTESETIELNST